MVKVKKLIIFLIILLLSSFIFIPFNVNALDFGDGNYSRDQNCNHTYIHEGIYEVSLTVGNRFGSDTAYSSITVSAIPSGGGGGTSPWLYTLFPGFIILIMVIIVMRILFNERMER